MDLSKPNTAANLEAAFGGESMANRKYLFLLPSPNSSATRTSHACSKRPRTKKRSTPLPTSACCTLTW